MDVAPSGRGCQQFAEDPVARLEDLLPKGGELDRRAKAVPLASIATSPGIVATSLLRSKRDQWGRAPRLAETAAAARDPRTRWCVTAVARDGTAAAHACAPGRHHPPPGGTGPPAAPRWPATWTTRPPGRTAAGPAAVTSHRRASDNNTGCPSCSAEKEARQRRHVLLPEPLGDRCHG
jgi:hypothetical protein